jgi:hypothetical protein
MAAGMVFPVVVLEMAAGAVRAMTDAQAPAGT